MAGRMGRVSAAGGLLTLVVMFTGCAAAPDSPSCEEVLAQASYEVMSQLAASGVASDPAALRAGMPREVDDDIDGSSAVSLPSYDVFTTEYSDAEQATLRSALTSSSVGVGEVFDTEKLYSTMATSGVCEGDLPH